jgi:hypothetical protein
VFCLTVCAKFTLGEALARIAGGRYFVQPVDPESLATGDMTAAPVPTGLYPADDPVMVRVLQRIMTAVYADQPFVRFGVGVCVVVEQGTDVSVGSTHPQHRQSACVWLVAQLQHAGMHPTVQAHLPTIQAALTHLLSDTRELTQEVAAKGVALVFDRGSEEMKARLVQELVETLSPQKAAAAIPRSTADSTILPAGLLGAAPKTMGVTFVRLRSQGGS